MDLKAMKFGLCGVNVLHSGWRLQLSRDLCSHMRRGQTDSAPNQWKVKIMQPHRKTAEHVHWKHPIIPLFLPGYTSLRLPNQIQRKLNVSP